MAETITPLIAGNWKMNGTSASLAEIAALIALVGEGPAPAAEIAVCPPATLLAAVSAACAPAGIATGGQDCHTAPGGAHTGDVSAPMLADAGARYVIVGHSERRAHHHEMDGLVREKCRAALDAGLVPILCVGESEPERMAALAITVVEQQLNGSLPENVDGREIVIAYEPVWAIGTGLTPTPGDIAEMHRHIREFLVQRLGEQGGRTRILYGGSVKPGNAAEILAIDEVDGALVGGASLKATDFHPIVMGAGSAS